MSVPPSGEQYEIALGEQRAVITEVGGGLRTYTLGERDVLLGYDLDEMCSAGRGQVLMPWPNRLEDGRYDFGGEEHQLPLTEPQHGNAIHGLVRWRVWAARERDSRRVVVGHVLHPQPGYPFTLDLEIAYELTGDGLVVRATATNVGTTPCPYGAGAHPYLTVGTETVDEVVLRVPARTLLSSNERGIPVGSRSVEGTELDFREARRIGAARLDHGLTDLERDETGLARVELRDNHDQHGATLWVDESYPYVMVFTGDLPAIGRRGLAVEPMTCAPNAFRTGDGLVRLEPGTTWAGAWGIEPSSSSVLTPGVQ